MNSMILSLGSNCRDRNVVLAINQIEAMLSNIRASEIYETPPARGMGRPYTNAVVQADSDLDFDDLNSRFKQLEYEFGRDDDCRQTGCVPIDIDIVVWNGSIIRDWDYRQDFFRIGLDMITEKSVNQS